MKYVKMLGLLAVAAAALMAFAGTASATLSTETIHAQSAGATSLTGSVTITCQNSTVNGDVTTDDADTAQGPITSLSFTNCGNHTVTVINPGELTLTEDEHNNTTATVWSKDAEVTVLLHSAIIGTVHCTYITPSTKTDIGTLTESDHDPAGPVGSHTTATLHISASIERDPDTSSGFCGEHATWEGTYEVTSPDHLNIT